MRRWCGYGRDGYFWNLKYQTISSTITHADAEYKHKTEAIIVSTLPPFTGSQRVAAFNAVICWKPTRKTGL